MGPHLRPGSSSVSNAGVTLPAPGGRGRVGVCDAAGLPRTAQAQAPHSPSGRSRAQGAPRSPRSTGEAASSDASAPASHGEEAVALPGPAPPPRRPPASRPFPDSIPRAGAWGSQAASGPALRPAAGRASGARLSVPPRGTRPLQVSGRSPTRLAARELSSHLYLNLECHRGGVASSRNSVFRRNHCFSAPCWS